MSSKSTSEAPPSYEQYVQTIPKHLTEGATSDSKNADDVWNSVDDYVNVVIARAIAVMKDPKKPRVQYTFDLNISGMTREIFYSLNSVRSYAEGGFKVTLLPSRYDVDMNQCIVDLKPKALSK